MKFNSDEEAASFYNEVEKRLNKKLAEEFFLEEINEMGLMDKEYLKQLTIDELQEERAGLVQAKYKYNKETGKYEIYK